MNNASANINLAVLSIQRLNDDLKYWEEKALAASKVNDDDSQRKAVEAQESIVRVLVARGAAIRTLRGKVG